MLQYILNTGQSVLTASVKAHSESSSCEHFLSQNLIFVSLSQVDVSLPHRGVVVVDVIYPPTTRGDNELIQHLKTNFDRRHKGEMCSLPEPFQ